MNEQLVRLLETHARIDQALRNEQRRPLPDFALTARLKKLKLRIKDRILRRAQRPARV
jgi:hypothetical protein